MLQNFAAATIFPRKFSHYTTMQRQYFLGNLTTTLALSHRIPSSLNLKGAQTYCIINERDQPAAKECNRKLY